MDSRHLVLMADFAAKDALVIQNFGSHGLLSNSWLLTFSLIYLGRRNGFLPTELNSFCPLSPDYHHFQKLLRAEVLQS